MTCHCAAPTPKVAPEKSLLDDSSFTGYQPGEVAPIGGGSSPGSRFAVEAPPGTASRRPGRRGGQIQRRFALEAESTPRPVPASTAMRRRPPSRRFWTWHRWLGLTILLPLVWWTGTALVFALRPIEEIRGRTYGAPARSDLASLTGAQPGRHRLAAATLA
jgi:hypothetical protein